MTLKEIDKMSNDDCFELLKKYIHIKENLCYKTKYELPNSIREMKDIAKQIQEFVKEG